MSNETKPSHVPLSSSEYDLIYQSIKDLNKSELREEALKELSKKRENVPDLAPLLWYSPGAIAALLQEICAVYYYISPPNLTAVQSNRVCNALALLQGLAAHRETRGEFLSANIPLYLYPFLNTSNQSRPFEYLRLTSLGVIDEADVIQFLLGSGIIPHCLMIMENGSELSRTVATFIMEKLLLDDYGLQYICQTFDRFKHVASILSLVVSHLTKDPSGRLLKHVVRCYLRLSDHPGARVHLGSMLPTQLTDDTFQLWLDKDPSTKRWLNLAIRTISGGGHNSGAANENLVGLDFNRGGMSINPIGDSRPGSIAVGTNTAGSN